MMELSIQISGGSTLGGRSGGCLVPGATKGRRCVPKLAAAGCASHSDAGEKNHWGEGSSMGLPLL